MNNARDSSNRLAQRTIINGKMSRATGVRIVLHAALIGHVAYQRAIVYFFNVFIFNVFISYVFIFLEKQFAIGGMAYFDE
jgi:hypothetical protein